MAQYAEQSDIENVFGEANVAKWSQLDPDETTADTDRIEVGLVTAAAAIDDRFREGRYAVPLVGTSGSTPAVVRDWCAKLAGAWLYSSRLSRDGDNPETDRVAALAASVHAEIDFYLAGQRRLPCVLNTSGGGITHTTPFTV